MRGKDPDWTDREAEGLPETEDQPPGVDAESAEEGSFPPRDRPLGAEEWGTTPGEVARGESVEQRAARERPDVVGRDERPMRVADPSTTDGDVETEDPASGPSAEEEAVRIDER